MKTLYLIHGFLEDNSMWEGVEDVLSSTFNLKYLEIPGHGNTPYQGERSLAEVAVAFLQKIEDDAYWIVGHSLGGYVGLELLGLDQRAQGLVLLNSNFWTDSPLRKNNRLRSIEVVEENKSLFIKTAIPSLFMETYREEHLEVVRSLVDKALKMDEKAIIAATKWMLNRRDFSKASVLNSTILVHGDCDNLIPMEMVQEKAGKTNCELVVLEGIGHMAPFEMEPHAFLSLIKSSVEKVLS